MTVECPKCGRVAVQGSDETLYASILDRCGDRDGPRVVDAIRLTLDMDQRQAEYINQAAGYPFVNDDGTVR